MKDSKIPLEVEFLIWKELANHICSKGKAGFSFSFYHSLEIEVFLTMGYFVKFESEFKAPIEHSDYQLNVIQGKLKPKKNQKILCVGPQRRLRFFKRWCIKVSKSRG